MKKVPNLIYRDTSFFGVQVIGDSKSLEEHLKIQVSYSPLSSELLQRLQHPALPIAPSLSIKTHEW